MPGNIAQGEARYSLVEIETELLIAKDLGYIAANDAEFVLKLAPETGHIIPRSLAARANVGQSQP